jgi:hypothetical protein
MKNQQKLEGGKNGKIRCSIAENVVGHIYQL